MMGWGYRPYVSVAKRQTDARRQMEKLRKKGHAIQGIEIEGRKITRTFWGQSWCQHLESFSDYANRLPRGRTYVRNGSVCHLEITGGVVKAIVSGSQLYDVKIEIQKLPHHKWSTVKERCSGQIGSLLELLQGMLSISIMNIVTDRQEGLFPLPSEIRLDCSCPDWAVMCKHVAAVLYGVGARLDEKPELLFLLRGVDHQELIEAQATVGAVTGKRSGRRLEASELEDLFGIEMVDDKSADRSDDKTSAEDYIDSNPSQAVAKKKISAKKALQKKEQDKKAKRPVILSPNSLPTGETIRQLRAYLEMSEAQLAQLMGVTPITIKAWEKSKAMLNLQGRTLSALHDARKLSKKQAWSRITN